LAHPLLLVRLLVGDLHPEGVAVERDRLVQVGHRDADVVDAEEEVLGYRQGGGLLAHGHIVVRTGRRGNHRPPTVTRRTRRLSDGSPQRGYGSVMSASDPHHPRTPPPGGTPCPET